jgi:hypothetical protein
MNSAICTLYEGHYHHGVAALSNSLYKNGFRGSIYVGYRGELPPWALKASDNQQLNWPEGKTLLVAEGLELHFLPLVTDYHLTNYKPDFMLQLWNGPAKYAEAMFYFDPDIVIVALWHFFEEWVECGITVCEDVNSPLEKYHPRRIAWRNYFKEFGFTLNFKSHIYVNGGFIGLIKNDNLFLETWKKIQESMAESIGGLNRSKISGEKIIESASGGYTPFGSSDQDALNATIEVSESIISIIGKEGMGFKNGSTMMFHALGKNKPWLYKPFTDFLKGSSPRSVDKEYVKNILYPIQLSSRLFHFKFQKSIKVVSLLSRFYSKPN